MPGYEVKFTGDVDKSFECPVCLVVLKEPVQVTPCGHRLCKTCLQPILRYRRPRCPLDNLPLNPNQVNRIRFLCRHDKSDVIANYSEESQFIVFDDNACHRQVLSLEVFCANSQQGCQWTGLLYELERHGDFCGYANIPCPKNCGSTFHRKDLETHLQGCLYRLVTCQHCGQKINFVDMSFHLQGCASFPIPCPMKCGAIDLTKETLAAHVNVDCHLLIVPCKFIDAGCKFKAERHKMKDHLKDEMERHLALLCNLVNEQRKEIDLHKEKLQLQKEHLQLQKDALASHRQEIIEIRSQTANGEFIWKIKDFSRKLMDAKAGRVPEPLVSEPFYTNPQGYKMCAGVWLNGIGTGRGKYVSVGLQVQVGEYDAVLKWPIHPKYSFTLLDQCQDSKERRDILATFDPQSIERPTVDKQLGKGARRFVLQQDVCGGTYCKDDVVFIRFSVSLKSPPSHGFFRSVNL